MASYGSYGSSSSSVRQQSQQQPPQFNNATQYDPSNDNQQRQAYNGQYSNQSQQYQRGGNNQEPYPGQETSGDVNRVSQQIRDTRQETVMSIQNSLRTMQESEDSAMRTMVKLGEQSDQLGNIERTLDISQEHADDARDRTTELKHANRSMFSMRIKNPFTAKQRKRREEELARLKTEQAEANSAKIQRDELDTRQRVLATTNPGTYGTYGRYGDNGSGYAYNGDASGSMGGNQEQPQRNVYGFENTAEDDMYEDEIDKGLDALSAQLTNLKQSALRIGEEVGHQNERLSGVAEKTTNLGGTVTYNTERLQNIGKKG